MRFKVRNPDGNPLHVRYENTGPVDARDGNTATGAVGYAEHRLTKKGDVTLVLSGLDAGELVPGGPGLREHVRLGADCSRTATARRARARRR